MSYHRSRHSLGADQFLVSAGGKYSRQSTSVMTGFTKPADAYRGGGVAPPSGGGFTGGNLQPGGGSMPQPPAPSTPQPSSGGTLVSGSAGLTGGSSNGSSKPGYGATGPRKPWRRTPLSPAATAAQPVVVQVNLSDPRRSTIAPPVTMITNRDGNAVPVIADPVVSSSKPWLLIAAIGLGAYLILTNRGDA